MRSAVPVERHVVVAMDDRALVFDDLDGSDPTGARSARADRDSLATSVVEVAGTGGGLPLAAARNAGAEVALRMGAELLIFLDVDCLPDPQLVGHYVAAAERSDLVGTLLCGPVAYLPPPPPGGYDLDAVAHHPPHRARPAPTPGECLTDGDHRLFWSLSFAVTATTWPRIGGFAEAYVGYGAEDTDYACRAEQAGVGITWVGGASAFHQWHETQNPPTQHLSDILRNGAIFAERWGWWPMEGWLSAFCDRGLIRWDDAERRYERLVG